MLSDIHDGNNDNQWIIKRSCEGVSGGFVAFPVAPGMMDTILPMFEGEKIIICKEIERKEL